MDTFPLPDLAPNALADLRSEFARHGHCPSPEQWQALEALLDTFDNLAQGHSDPALYLSALDPGVGKTSAVIAYLRRLMVSASQRHVGVLLCLYRLDEIERLAGALSGPGMTLAVRTSDDDLNSMTNAEVDDAQVLIITQQRLELICKGRRFGEARSLFYDGSPRALRIWDESFLPGRAVTLSSSDIAALMRWVEQVGPEARDAVKDLMAAMEATKEGDVVSVPLWDFVGDGVRLSAASKPLRYGRVGVGHRKIPPDPKVGQTFQPQTGERDTLAADDGQKLEDLFTLSGKAFTVRRNGRIQVPTLAAFRRTLPDDLLPLVVLDASGRVRTTYDDLSTTMPIVRLPVATKDYGSLTINVWDRGGGKTAFDTDQKAEEIIGAIADLIEGSDHQGRWLVVCHKESLKVPDLEGMLQKLLTPTTWTKVDLVTWGNHAAVNAYSDTERVILAGTLFYPDSYYEGLKRLCLDKGADEVPLTDDDLAGMRTGENGHLVLQALCRASVRKSDNGNGRSCTAYLIASKRSAIRQKLPEWFPGCQVGSWEPKGPKQLVGHPARVFEYVAQWAKKAAQGKTLRFSTIYTALGIREDVFREVRRNGDLKTALASIGVHEIGGPKLKTGYGPILVE